MTVESQLRAAEERIWRALQAHDSMALERELDQGFVHSSPGSPDQDRETFLVGAREMPFRILEIGWHPPPSSISSREAATSGASATP